MNTYARKNGIPCWNRTSLCGFAGRRLNCSANGMGKIEVAVEGNRLAKSAMPKAKPSIPKPAQLRDAFIADLASCWQYARSLHPKETPYAFALHGLEGTPQFYPQVVTEESLTQVAKRYVADGYHETVEEARKELRYSMEDSPYTSELDEKLPTVNALMEPVARELDETEGYDLLAKAAMDAFVALDKRGTFGKGKQREKLTLIIDTSFAEKDWSLPSVRKLNPRATISRYVAQTKEDGTYASGDGLCFSPDGKSVYFACSREIDPRKQKDLFELVACDVRGLRLKRRWSISFPRFGTSIRSTACASDGTLFVLRSRIVDSKSKTVLMRFAKGNKALFQQVELVGSPCGLAVASDGSRVFVSQFDNSIHLFDGNLASIGSKKLKDKVRSPTFLKSKDILGTTSKGIVRIDAKLEVMPTAYRDDAWTISLDKAEKLCAVSKYNTGTAVYNEKPKNQFGFKLIDLPSCKERRSIQIPAHQLRWTELSPDGKLAACEDHECGKAATFVVVYEMMTGREIARQRSRNFGNLVFHPKQNVLAMTTSGMMVSEPVVLWKLS